MAKRFYLLFILLVTMLFLFSCEKDREPVVPTNNNPTIDSIFTNRTKIKINTEIKLISFAKDIDGDTLIYNWFSKRGKFSSQIGNSIVWKAPNSIGTDTILVRVTDGKASVERIIVIIVGNVPSIPHLLMPTNNKREVELNTKLVWRHDSGISNSTIQLSTDADFKYLLVNKNVTRTYFVTPALDTNTTYYWRVKSTNDFGTSNWSRIFSFTTVTPPLAPRLILPDNFSNKIEINPKLFWESIFNASEYLLMISEDKEFASGVLKYKIIRDTSFQIYDLKHFTTYYWRVKAFNQYGQSDWSQVFQFNVIGTIPKQTNLLAPSNNSYNVKLVTELLWQKTAFAEKYLLEVSEDSLFKNIIIANYDLLVNNYEISNLKHYTRYFWRISSANEYGVSEWTTINTFTTLIAAPNLANPDFFDNGRPLSPEFKWDQIIGAESYSMQVALDSTFNDVVFSDTSITAPKHKISGLLDYTNYYWRIAANNKLGNSDWSSTQTFKTTGYYFQGLPYGTQALYNPSYVILTGGFGMIQFDAKRDVIKFPYNIAVKNIWKNLTDPFTPINNYGWWNFFQDQIFPLSLNKQNAQFWPNYSLHLIGGGMAYAKTREWFKYYNYPYPALLSAFTTMTYHFINEVVENGYRVGDDVDPIADFYLFDIGGIVLFSSESVKRFFAEDLNLSDWSQQPSFSLKNGELHNNDQFFSIKWKFPFAESWHAFYYFGTNGVGGLSYKFKDGSAISVGAGLAASDLIVLDEKTNKKTLGLVGNFAAFYDRNNSLLASLAITIKTDYMINLNIYPGLLKFWGVSPGLWGAYSQNGNYIFGITASWLPFGFAYSTK